VTYLPQGEKREPPKRRSRRVVRFFGL